VVHGQLISVIVSANMAAIGVIINAYMLLEGAPNSLDYHHGSKFLTSGNMGRRIALVYRICFTSYKLSKEEIKEKSPSKE
jgi:hypothetical protein